MKNFFSAMLKCKDSIIKKRDKASAEAYLNLRKFLETEKYSSCKKANEIAKLTLDGYDVHYIASYFGKSYDTIRTEKRRISDELWKMFPKDFFERFEDFSKNQTFINGCLSSLGSFNLTSDKILFLELVNTVRTKSGLSYDGKFDYALFREELQFLKLYSKLFIDSDLENVDISKLKYLLDVLDGRSGSIFEKGEILKIIKGGD